MKRKINIFTKFLKKNNPETIPDPPVEYLRNNNLHVIVDLFPTAFTYEIMLHETISLEHRRHYIEVSLQVL